MSTAEKFEKYKNLFKEVHVVPFCWETCLLYILFASSANNSMQLTFSALHKSIFLLLICVVFMFYRYLVLTTSGGIMDHEEARRKHLGGKILGFFF